MDKSLAHFRIISGEYYQTNTSTYLRKNVKLALDPIVHENYKDPKADSNDIALLKLAEDVDLNTYTPACLPTSGADYTGQNGRVYGSFLRMRISTYT